AGAEMVVVAAFVALVLTVGVESDVEAEATSGTSADTTLLAAVPKIVATAEAALMVPQHDSDDTQGSVPLSSYKYLAYAMLPCSVVMSSPSVSAKLLCTLPLIWKT